MGKKSKIVGTHKVSIAWCFLRSVYMTKRKIALRIGARAALRGGNWNNSSNAGLFNLNLNNTPSNADWNIGFRCSNNCMFGRFCFEELKRVSHNIIFLIIYSYQAIFAEIIGARCYILLINWRKLLASKSILLTYVF